MGAAHQDVPPLVRVSVHDGRSAYGVSLVRSVEDARLYWAYGNGAMIL
jgi:hypothetical protein